MKKLFIAFIMSFMFIFVVWTVIAYVNYGLDMVNYHLDLVTTFKKINLFFGNDELSGLSFFATLRSFRENLSTLTQSSLVAKILTNFGGDSFLQSSNAFLGLLSVLEGLIDPIISIAQSVMIGGYLIVLLTQLFGYFVNFSMGLYEFLFNPVFIHI